VRNLSGRWREPGASKDGVLFDLDGTLVDSSRLHEKAYREALSEHAPALLEGFDYESAERKIDGRIVSGPGHCRGGALEALASGKQRRYRAAVEAGELRLMPGQGRSGVLAAAAQRLFVVTGGSRRSTMPRSMPREFTPSSKCHHRG